MAKIRIEDLPEDKELFENDIKEVLGGSRPIPLAPSLQYFNVITDGLTLRPVSERNKIQ